jgi:F0F1-type ATP synthase assembly protein I
MIEQVVKVLLTSILVVAASEAAKRSALLGAILASLPLTSLMAMVWLYADTRDPEKVAALATGIFWLILPSLTLLLVLPLLLRKGVPFAPSIAVGIALTAVSYFAMIAILKRFGIDV